MQLISVRHLNKTMDKKRVLNDVSLNIDTGSIYGLIGPNGSGKTMLIRHMVGLYRPDSGEILYDGVPVWEDTGIKNRMAYVSDVLGLMNTDTLKTTASFFSSVYTEWDEARFNEMCESFHIREHGRIRSFSRGLRRQAAFILAMSIRPKYLILDEPVYGIDPLARRLFQEYIRRDVNETGMSVLISSYNIQGVEGFCDRIGIISRGRIKYENDLKKIQSDLHKIQIAFDDSRPVENRFRGLDVLQHRVRGSVEELLVRGAKNEIAAEIRPMDPVLFDFLPLSLEEVFFYEMEGEEDGLGDAVIRTVGRHRP